MANVQPSKRTVHRLSVWLFIGACVAMVPVLFVIQRNGPIWDDSVYFLVYRDSWSWGTFFRPGNGQWMFVTSLGFLIDRELFWPGAQTLLQLFSITAQVAVASVVFAWLRRRVDGYLALAGALIVLTFGAGWEVLTWSFNFGWLTSIATGIGAMLVFERPDSRKTRVLASTLLLISVVSMSFGVLIAMAIGVQVFYKDRRKKVIWTLAFPSAAWLIWSVVFASRFTDGSSYMPMKFLPAEWPGFVFELVQATFAGFAGGDMAWGAPLAVVILCSLGFRAWRLKTVSPELASIFALPVLYAMVLAVTRTQWGADSSRYCYTLAVPIVMLAGELFRGAKLQSPAQFLVATPLVVLVCFAGVAELNHDSKIVKRKHQADREYMTALYSVGRAVACSTHADPPDVLNPGNNCRWYKWMASADSQRLRYSRSELKSQPAVRKRVERMIEQIQTAKVSDPPVTGDPR